MELAIANGIHLVTHTTIPPKAESRQSNNKKNLWINMETKRVEWASLANTMVFQFWPPYVWVNGVFHNNAHCCTTTSMCFFSIFFLFYFCTCFPTFLIFHLFGTTLKLHATLVNSNLVHYHFFFFLLFATNKFVDYFAAKFDCTKLQQNGKIMQRRRLNGNHIHSRFPQIITSLSQHTRKKQHNHPRNYSLTQFRLFDWNNWNTEIEQPKTSRFLDALPWISVYPKEGKKELEGKQWLEPVYKNDGN